MKETRTSVLHRDVAAVLYSEDIPNLEERAVSLMSEYFFLIQYCAVN